MHLFDRPGAITVCCYIFPTDARKKCFHIYSLIVAAKIEWGNKYKDYKNIEIIFTSQISPVTSEEPVYSKKKKKSKISD